MKKEGKFSSGRYCVANRWKPSFSVERVPVKSSGGAISLNGAVSSTGTVSQPFQWSSEYHDPELSLTYYNFRHYNPTDGRWLSRDPIMEYGGWNLYKSFENKVYYQYDGLGLWAVVDDLVATTVGAVVAVAGQLVSDAVNGELSSWKDYALSAGLGAISGELSLYIGPIWGGVIYGASHSC